MRRHCSIILCLAVAVLVVLGLVMLTSTGAWVRNVEQPYLFVRRQSVVVVIGVIAAVASSRVSEELMRKYWPLLMVVCCVFLALCFVPGVGVAELGSARWIRLPGLGQFQPSEMGRICCVIALAGWFARWQTETRTLLRGFILPGMIISAPILLIAAETDVGTALSISVACAAILFCAGTRLLFLVPTAVSSISMAVWYVLHDTVRRKRIDAWLNLEDPYHQLRAGMQQWRALLAFGNGGPTGVGLGNGYEKFGTLTYAHIDFIFPEIGEELGLIGTLLTVLCYVLITVCGIGIAAQAKTMFSRLMAVGLTCVIAVPAMVNIAVTTAVLPNDGLPLPFVSYGGTSVIFGLISVGLLVGIHRRSVLREVPEIELCQRKRYAIRL